MTTRAQIAHLVADLARRGVNVEQARRELAAADPAGEEIRWHADLTGGALGAPWGTPSGGHNQ